MSPSTTCCAVLVKYVEYVDFLLGQLCQDLNDN